MSRFYANIQGNRGQATRQGTKNSGIRGHVRGWNVGISVVGQVNENGDDIFTVFLTSGSNGSKPEKLIGGFMEKDLK